MNNLESNPLTFASSAVADVEPQRPVWIDRLCQRWVLQAFEPMARGELLVHLPDGSSRRFGRGTDGPKAEIRVRRPEFFRKSVLHGDVGFGEAYQDGDWDSPDLVAVIGWFCANTEQAPTLSGSRQRHWQLGLLAALDVLRLELDALALEPREVVLVGADRLAGRDQVVARVARLHLHQLAHLAELVDALHQDEFDHVVPPGGLVRRPHCS